MPHIRSASLRSITAADSGLVPGDDGGLVSPDMLSERAQVNSTEDAEDALNVVIPIGGIGSRFQKEGYRYPKPLINIVGKPMICWLIERLSFRPKDTLWIAINDEIEEEFQMGQVLKKTFPELDIQLLRLHYLTKGATETLFIVTQSMPAHYLGRRTVSLDCDTIYFADVLGRIREMPPNHGGCFYFPVPEGSEPIFSYIKTSTNESGHEIITDIQEKRAISTKANSGAYVFPSAAILRDWAAAMLDSKLDPEDDKLGEYFTSQMIEMMVLSSQIPFIGVPISLDDFSSVGTPKQLQEFLRYLQHHPEMVSSRKVRFCFDLDGTLVGVPQVAGDYSTCPPIWKNIKLVQGLHRAGHHITIYSARRMRTHNGNVGAVWKDVGMVTYQSLEKYCIPYDEMHFGKPYAHVYVDDLAVNANLDTYQELGWTEPLQQSINVLAEVKHAKKAGVVASRNFNHVQAVGEKIMKSSSASQILGEMFFYSRMPDQIRDLFPEVHSINHLPANSMYTITMEKLNGTTYAHLLAGRSLTSGRFLFLLDALRRIHSASSTCSQFREVPKELSMIIKERHHAVDHTSPAIYDNYCRKLRSRYASYRAEYDALGVGITSQLLNTLLTRLGSYESDQRAVFAEVIHGDPVFSNAILDETKRRVNLIDVRSQLGATLTMAGDVAYDLAKILQSLQGYDHVILASDETLERTKDVEHALKAVVPGQDRLLLKQLQDEVFWPFIKAQYGDRFRRSDLLDITASLLFSLIPLHREAVRPVFLKMCQNVVEFGMAFPV